MRLSLCLSLGLLLLLVQACDLKAPDFKAPTVKRLTSDSGTYTTPAGVRYIEVEMCGGGGGGSYGNGESFVGSGGGAGAYAKFICSVLSPQTFKYKVGAGGAFQTDGQSSTFSNILLAKTNTCPGGNRGNPDGPKGGFPSHAPDLNYGTIVTALEGGGGNVGARPLNGAGPGGSGGNNPFGGGGGGPSYGSAGFSGLTNTGAGGAGAPYSNQNPGLGGSGIIIIKEYYQ